MSLPYMGFRRRDSDEGERLPDTDPEHCYTAALRILNYRFNSETELRRKLERKNFSAEVVETTMQRLREEKWLDDSRFAGAFVRTKQLRKLGPRRIARELMAAGVEDEIVRSAISQNVDETASREALTTLCRRRVATLVRRKGEEYAASAEGRNKISIYLLNQGYDGALVREVVKEVLMSFRAGGTPEG